MTCEKATVAMFERESGALEEDVSTHLAQCEVCTQLRQTLREGESAAPAQAHLDSIKEVLLRDLRPVEPLPSSWTLLPVLAAVCIGIVGIGAVVLGVRGWQALAVSMRFSIFAPVVLGTCLLGLTAVRQMRPGNGPPARSFAWSCLMFALVVLVAATAFDGGQDPDFLTTGLNCFLVGTFYGASGAFTIWLVIRRGAMLSKLWTGLLVGSQAGFLGLAVVEIRCPSANGYHILVWHLPLVVAGAFGGLAVTAMRRQFEVRDSIGRP